MAVPVYAALAGYQIISGFQQAEMVGMQADIQRQIDEFNAELAEFDAWKVQAYGQTQVARYQSQVDQTEAAAKVSAAGANVKIEGSLAEVAAQNDVIAQANILTIENQAREAALGYTRQAQGIRIGSQLNQMTAKTQQAAIRGGAIAQGLGTVARGFTTPSPNTTPGSESGYSLPTLQQTPGSYLTGSSEDLGGTGYLSDFSFMP